MNPESNKTKRVVVIGIVAISLIAVIVVGKLLWTKYVDHKVVTLSASNGTSISIGRPASGDGPPSIEKVIAKATSEQLKVRLAPGSYTVLFSGDDYVNKYDSINIPPSTYITTPHLKFSDKKLKSLLVKQKPKLKKAISDLDNIAGYTVSYEKLYGVGDFYGAKLLPKDTSKEDTLRVILQNKDGKWGVVAPPSIVFYIGDFPKIPEDAIRDINNK